MDDVALAASYEARIDYLNSEVRRLRLENAELREDLAELDARDRRNKETLKAYAPRSVLGLGHE